MVRRVNPALAYLVGAVLGALAGSSYAGGDGFGTAFNLGFAVLVLSLIVYGEIQEGALADVSY